MRRALDVYGRALAGGGGLRLLQHSGRVTALPVSAWTSDEAPGDGGLLARCRGPVLDVGCGPGRLAAALMARGIPALGVDIAPCAVALARARGATALERSVYERLPAERRWVTALLADGNVGIGGDPVALLRRVRALLGARGAVLVELEGPGTGLQRASGRLETPAGHSSRFAWGRVGVDAVELLAAEAGFAVADVPRAAGRWFARLAVAPATAR
jgi:SAM-dependent methyltransferase